LVISSAISDAIAEIEAPEIAEDITNRLDAWLKRRRS